MNFVLKRFLLSLLKKAVAAAVAFLTGPKLLPYVAAFGITDPTALSTGIFAILEGLRIWLTHQKWTPDWLKKVL